jgi:hypothetical protein
MTESFRSAVALRNDICTSVADLQQRYTAPLPDAATVFVTDTVGLYRLAKGLGSGFDSLLGRVVIPADGSSNRWVQQEANGSSPWSGVEVATAQNNITPIGPTIWTALGTTPGSFALAAGDTDMFEVNATSSLMTYHGVPRFMMLTATVSIFTALADSLSIVVSHNNDVPAGSNASHRSEGQQAGGTRDVAEVNISSQRSLFMAPGATLRLMAKNLAVQDMQVTYFSLSAVSL